MLAEANVFCRTSPWRLYTRKKVHRFAHDVLLSSHPAPVDGPHLSVSMPLFELWDRLRSRDLLSTHYRGLPDVLWGYSMDQLSHHCFSVSWL